MIPLLNFLQYRWSIPSDPTLNPDDLIGHSLSEVTTSKIMHAHVHTPDPSSSITTTQTLQRKPMLSGLFQNGVDVGSSMRAAVRN